MQRTHALVQKLTTSRAKEDQTEHEATDPTGGGRAPPSPGGARSGRQQPAPEWIRVPPDVPIAEQGEEGVPPRSCRGDHPRPTVQFARSPRVAGAQVILLVREPTATGRRLRVQHHPYDL